MADKSNDVTVAEAFEFFSQRSAREEQNFADKNDKDIPDHSEALVADSATDLLKTVTSIDMSYAMADEDDTVDEEQMNERLAEAVVDLLASVGTLKHERDIDIASAIEERMGFLRDFEQFENAMEDAETKDEQMEAMDEHLTEEIEKEVGIAQPTDVGDNVDADSYDHGDVGRSFQ